MEDMRKNRFFIFFNKMEKILLINEIYFLRNKINFGNLTTL